jgi:1,4-alpha-glucan branching enzyme
MTTNLSGNVALVLNAHFPYVRRAGRWPHGEEALHEVIAESYVPLLTMLHDLRTTTSGGAPLTLAISPILLEQLADPVITKHFTVWLGELRERADADLTRFESQSDGHGAYLARFYIDWIDSIEHAVVERFSRNLATAIRSLARDTIEILLTPATYAYLPQLTLRDVRAQLDVAALAILRQLHPRGARRPAGLWLPGGGRPNALHVIAAELGLRYAVGGPAERSGIGRYADGLPTVHGDRALAEHVIAPSIGYPGDGLYREFYREHPDSGLHYWRVTGADAPLEAKQWYDPYLAFSRAEEHAAHFVRAIRDRLQSTPATDAPPTVVIAFDAELCGHWWFEGVRWLQHVLSRLLAAEDLRLVTLDQVVATLPPLDAPLDALSPHPLFDDPLTAPLQERLRTTTRQLAAVVQRHPTADALTEAMLEQAARELLLAQSSDWSALIATGSASEYAQRRFNEHLSRVERLLHYTERDEPTPDAENYLNEIAELDNPFQFINYRMFR